MSEDFKIWWHREGSGMPPLKGEETCEHVERVSAIAWANGAYKATETLEAENARLKAEVERLTKAGDAMASSIQFNEEMSQDYNGPTIVHQSVQRWNAAKGGKQS
jgi:hypothetical protein